MRSRRVGPSLAVARRTERTSPVRRKRRQPYACTDGLSPKAHSATFSPSVDGVPPAGVAGGREASLAILPDLHEPVEVQAVEEELRELAPCPAGTRTRLSVPADLAVAPASEIAQKTKARQDTAPRSLRGHGSVEGGYVGLEHSNAMQIDGDEARGGAGRGTTSRGGRWPCGSWRSARRGRSSGSRTSHPRTPAGRSHRSP